MKILVNALFCTAFIFHFAFKVSAIPIVRVLSDAGSPPQLQLVRIEQPFHARNVAEIIIDPSGAGIPDVGVERMDSKFVTTIQETTTDARGAFHFSDLPNGTYYLRLSKPGFDPTEVTVMTGGKYDKQLTISLPIAT